MKSIMTVIIMVAIALTGGTAKAAKKCQSKQLLKQGKLVVQYIKATKLCKNSCRDSCVRTLATLNNGISTRLAKYNCTWTSQELVKAGLIKVTSLEDLGCPKAKKNTTKKPAAKTQTPANPKITLVANKGAPISPCLMYGAWTRAYAKGKFDGYRSWLTRRAKKADNRIANATVKGAREDLAAVAGPLKRGAKYADDFSKFIGADISVDKSATDAAFKAAGCVRNSNNKLVCSNNIHKRQCSTLKGYWDKKKSQDPNRYVAVFPWITRCEQAVKDDDAEAALYAVWEGVARGSLKDILFLTASPNQIFAESSLKDGKPEDGDTVTGLTHDGVVIGKFNKKNNCVEQADGMCLKARSVRSTTTGGNGFLGNDLVGNRLFSKDSWWGRNMPAIRLSFDSRFFSGTGTDFRHGRSWSIESGGYSVGGSLGVEGVLKRWANRKVALLYGVEISLKLRKTSYLEVDDSRGKKVDSSYFTVGVGGRFGVNLYDWVSVYGMGEFRPNPLGGNVGGGLEITGFGPVRVAIEGGLSLSDDKVNTGIPGASPANFSGPFLGTKIRMVF